MANNDHGSGIRSIRALFDQPSPVRRSQHLPSRSCVYPVCHCCTSTPWTTPRDVLDIVEFVAAHDLVANVDPVQYTIRLLVPEGSLLLEREDLREHLGPYDAERLSFPWRSADPAADRLQARLSALVQQSAAAQEATGLAFARIRAAVREANGEACGPEPHAIPMGSTEGRPRLTEPWFC